VVTGPDSIIYGMTVSGFRLKQGKYILVLHTHTGETMTLVSIGDEEYRWELRVPLEFHPVPIMEFEFISQ